MWSDFGKSSVVILARAVSCRNSTVLGGTNLVMSLDSAMGLPASDVECSGEVMTQLVDLWSPHNQKGTAS